MRCANALWAEFYEIGKNVHNTPRQSICSGPQPKIKPFASGWFHFALRPKNVFTYNLLPMQIISYHNIANSYRCAHHKMVWNEHRMKATYHVAKWKVKEKRACKAILKWNNNRANEHFIYIWMYISIWWIFACDISFHSFNNDRVRARACVCASSFLARFLDFISFKYLNTPAAHWQPLHERNFSLFCARPTFFTIWFVCALP